MKLLTRRAARPSSVRDVGREDILWGVRTIDDAVAAYERLRGCEAERRPSADEVMERIGRCRHATN